MNKIFASFLSILLISSLGYAESSSVYVPTELKPWVQWVKDKDLNADCALIASSHSCVWPGYLKLDVGKSSGTFRMTVRVDRKEARVQLPGGKLVWPVNVRSSGEDVTVLHKSARPVAFLKKGNHEVVGEFLWQEMPKFIKIPASIGRIELNANGERVRLPRVNNKGELWLLENRLPEQTEQDSLSVNVFRKLTDGVPFGVQTRIDLTIAGKARDIEISNVFLAGSKLVSVNSDLQYRLEGEDKVVIQGKPGRYALYLDSNFPSPPETLHSVQSSLAEWPDEEIWVWQADTLFRSAQVKGASQIDPNRTELPQEWRMHPTYLVTPDTQVTFDISQRGEGQARPNKLNLQRRFWLDLDGRGYTIQDRFNGTMNQAWRLDADTATELGRVSSHNVDQVITASKDGKTSGVELRERSLSLVADSRLEDARGSFMAVGWESDVSDLSVDVLLPPGWRVLGATGPDSVLNSWISKWTLMDFFLIFLVAIATGKLIGFGWGVVALLALTLAHAETGAPLTLWFHLLAAVALRKVLPEESESRKYVNYYYYAVILFLGLTLFFFAISQVLYGLFPNLAPITMYIPSSGGQNYATYNDARVASSISALFAYIEGSFGALVMTGAFLAAFVSVFMRKFKTAGLLLCVALLAFVLRSVTATFFNDYSVQSSPYDSVINHDVVGNQARQSQVPSAAPMEYDELGGAVYSKASKIRKKQQVKKYDPNAIVQTGPGVPSWTWNAWRLRWSGPVERTEKVKLYLLGPWMNFLLSLLRILLLTALAAAFMGRNLFKIPVRGALTSLLLLAPLVVSSGTAHAEGFPDQKLLQELERRLEGNRCTSDCLAVQKLHIVPSDDRLVLEAHVSSKGESAWAIPGPATQLPFESVLLDNQVAQALRRDDKGFVWVRIPDGNHVVKVSFSVFGRNVVTFRFEQYPGSVSVATSKWTIDGLEKTGRVRGSLQLTRIADALPLQSGTSEKSSVTEVSIPEWYKINRHLTLGLPWVMTTTVTRMGSVDRPSIARFPVWSNESVASEEVLVEKGEVIARFDRGERSVHWDSTLQQSDTLQFVASEKSRQTEDWSLRCSSIFHCSASGLGVTQSIVAGKQEYYWKPFPGEKVSVEVTRPEAVSGDSITVQSAKAEYRPGERILEGSLFLNVNASRGAQLPLTLPEGSRVQSVLLDGVEVNLALKGRVLELPIAPRKQTIKVTWEQVYQRKALFKAPELSLGASMVNIDVSIRMPSARWMLLTGGPAWGPAVLFWGKLIVVLFVSLLLGCFKQLPLKFYEWFLLGLGLATLPTIAIAVPLLWFFLMDYRKKNLLENSRFFNLRQVFIVLFTLLTIAVYYVTVQNGLIMSPNMQVFGNGSNQSLLRWYLDMSSGDFPRPWVLSLPLWVWRGVALAWSLWIVLVLLRWLRWGWECFSEGELWRKVKTQ